MGIIYPGGGGGGTSSGLPEPISSDTRAAVFSNGAGGAVWRRPTNNDLGPAFSGTLSLSTATLVERGSTQSSVTATVSYANGTCTSASLATTYSGATDAGDVNLGSWSISSPFTSASASGTVKRNAAGGTDPVMTVTLTYASSTSGTLTTTDTTTWTYRVFDGLVASSVTTGDIDEAMIEALTTNSLLQGRTLTTTRSPSSQKWLRAFPDLAPWTTGTVTFKDENAATFEFESYVTVSVTNASGVTCNYRAYLSTNVLTATNRSCVGT